MRTSFRSVRLTIAAICCAGAVPSAQPDGELPRSSTQETAPAHAVSNDYNRALGVSCEHCHTADRWKDDSKPPFRTAVGMARMVAALNTGALKGVGEVACWTCHRGDVRPSRVPRELMDAEIAKWPASLASSPESLKLTMSVYNVTLGVGCEHCHTADWKEYAKRPMTLVKTMASMFEEFPKYMPATARTQCYMCHKGSTKPELRPQGERRP